MSHKCRSCLFKLCLLLQEPGGRPPALSPDQPGGGNGNGGNGNGGNGAPPGGYGRASHRAVPGPPGGAQLPAEGPQRGRPARGRRAENLDARVTTAPPGFAKQGFCLSILSIRIHVL